MEYVIGILLGFITLNFLLKIGFYNSFSGILAAGVGCSLFVMAIWPVGYRTVEDTDSRFPVITGTNAGCCRNDHARISRDDRFLLRLLCRISQARYIL